MSEVFVAVSGPPDQERAVAELAASLGLPVATEAAFLLYLSAERLELRETGPNAAGPVYADFVAGRAEHRRKHGGGHSQTLARAVGLRAGEHPTIVDATAGLGRDAFVLASLGAEVTLLERSPVVAALLADGLRRAALDAEVGPIIARMTLVAMDAAAYLLTSLPDVVYLDPMYPHTNKTALPKKEMRLFRGLVGQDADAGEVLGAARAVAKRRAVVKRPKGAPPLADLKPSVQLGSKHTRFDIYLT